MADPIVVTTFTGIGSDLGIYVAFTETSWTQASEFDNVGITIYGFSNLGSPSTTTVYLTTAVGSGSTVATEVASTSFSLSASAYGTPVTENVFSGLSLPAGTYYLVAASPAEAFAWSSEATGYTLGTGVTGVSAAYSSSGNGAYAPASTFDQTLSGKGDGLLVSITGDPVAVSSAPEPAAIAVMGAALIGLTAARRRRGT